MIIEKSKEWILTKREVTWKCFSDSEHCFLKSFFFFYSSICGQTVHKAIKKKEPIDPPSLDEDILYPYAKEETLLQFSMEMKRETDEPLPDEEEDICTEENEESSFLVVTMEKTSVSVIIGRGCDTQRPCHECHTVTCEYSDIVMVTESSTVTLSKFFGLWLFITLLCIKPITQSL